eukprot:TRINITY_DN2819_c0_g1_i1.p1 TRINITY_DN2819_c0_g1~~TRINITY_DN2819_c0_g1_i1.p1  ORF type:complete len:228 (-),score=94.38 TRINITY_DN2819_c0_g1_i1:1088-1771(-)
MGGLFSSNNNNQQQQITAHDKAVLDLKNQRDKLNKYGKKLEVQMEKNKKIALELAKADKRKRALLVLKKNKQQESLYEKNTTLLTNIEEMISSIEFKQNELKVVESLREGANALKELNALMDIDEIDQLMLDTEEAMQYQKEIEEALYSGNQLEEFDDEIEKELQSLEKELGILDNLDDDKIILLDVPNDPIDKPEEIILPDAPNDSIEEPEKEKDDSSQRIAMVAN